VVGREAEIITSPPLSDRDLVPAWFVGREVLYLDLHGEAHSVYLYNSAGQAALSLATARGLPLAGTVIIALSCNLPETRFITAFLDAGAQAVVAGSGVNWGAWPWLGAAQVLARWTIWHLMAGAVIDQAMLGAKCVLRTSPWNSMVNHANITDALDFRIYRG
jgi:hypothetical protein